MDAPELKPERPIDLQGKALIQSNVIGKDDLAMLVDFANLQCEKNVTVSDAAGSNAQGCMVYKVDKRIRQAQRVNITPILEDIKRISQSNIQRFVSPYFTVTVRDFEKSKPLVYGSGGHHKPHIDGEGRSMPMALHENASGASRKSCLNAFCPASATAACPTCFTPRTM